MIDRRDLALRILAADDAASQLIMRAATATGPTVAMSRDEMEEIGAQLQQLALIARRVHAACASASEASAA